MKTVIKTATAKKTKKRKKTRKEKEKLAGNNITAILTEIGMSQQELADIALRGDAAYLSRIIQNKRKSLSLPIAIKIARALKRPVEKVFNYTDGK